jgi:putative transposase
MDESFSAQGIVLLAAGAFARDHPRRGFRPAYHDARGERWHVNHKRIQRLWREEEWRVPQRRRRKCHGTSTTIDTPTADAPNRVWAVDFQFDATTDGQWPTPGS